MIAPPEKTGNYRLNVLQGGTVGVPLGLSVTSWKGCGS